MVKQFCVLLFLILSAGTVCFSLKNPKPSFSVKSPAASIQTENPIVTISPVDSLQILAEHFNKLVQKIRDGKKDKQKARQEAGVLLAGIKKHYQSLHLQLASKKAFPVQGYNYKAIGGKNGEGYKPGSYNFYDGNKHTGHPAQDIFIYDNDQNGIDDKTGKPVNILSVTNGIVVATEPKWETTGNLRGGIYVMVYSPAEEMLYYYAHNQKLIVTPGAIVSAGAKLGELGRTGLNANKKRSPTHLHLMALKVKPAGNLVPTDLYPVLKLLK